jgi:hypothetical protein
MNYPTIVTMFYDIRKLDNTHINDNRQKNKYIELAKQFILLLPYPIIFFIDDEDNETYNIIYNIRNELNLLHFTHIFKFDLKKTYFYKDLLKLEELQTKFFIHNGDLKHETPLYIILTNNKLYFVEKAIELNPFNSSHFIWMDFGINHVAKNTELIHEWFTKVPDKIKQLCINPYIESAEPKKYFENIWHNCAGGLFSGSKKNLLKYVELFKQKTEKIYNENWYQLEEAVMTMVQRENYELFDFYYGDYEGIISNYLKPLHSWWLINTNIDKCLNMNNTKYLYNLLIYLDLFFSFEENQNNENFYKYINSNIICNYYQNDKCLRIEIINLINKKINENDPKMKDLLENNLNNLNFYNNKELIIKFES